MKKVIPDMILVKFLRLMAVVSGFFSILLCILIIINFIQLKRTDPLNTPALASIQERFIKDPGNTALQQDIRQLDLLARKAFFTSQRQIRSGGYLLFASLLLLVICVKSLELIIPKIPSVLAAGPENPWRRRKIQRRGVIIAGICLVTFTLLLAWITHQMLIPTAEITTLNATASRINSNPEGPEKQTSVASTASDSGNLQGNPGTNNITFAEGFPAQQEIQSNFPSFRGPGGPGIQRDGVAHPQPGVALL